MNILPHKSWNPWSKKNIEKVRKDEAELKRAEEEARAKAAQAERDTRFESLYKKRGIEVERFGESATMEGAAAIFGGPPDSGVSSRGSAATAMDDRLGVPLAPPAPPRRRQPESAAAEMLKAQRAALRLAAEDPLTQMKKLLWERDHPGETMPVERVCYRCGLPGHMSRSCPAYAVNEDKSIPLLPVPTALGPSLDSAAGPVSGGATPSSVGHSTAGSAVPGQLAARPSGPSILVTPIVHARRRSPSVSSRTESDSGSSRNSSGRSSGSTSSGDSDSDSHSRSGSSSASSGSRGSDRERRTEQRTGGRSSPSRGRRKHGSRHRSRSRSRSRSDRHSSRHRRRHAPSKREAAIAKQVLLQSLRAERLQREQEERARLQREQQRAAGR